MNNSKNKPIINNCGLRIGVKLYHDRRSGKPETSYVDYMKYEIYGLDILHSPLS